MNLDILMLSYLSICIRPKITIMLPSITYYKAVIDIPLYLHKTYISLLVL